MSIVSLIQQGSYVKGDVDEEPKNIASKYWIQGIPVVKFFCKGKEVGEVVVYIPKDNFKKDIDKIMITSAPSCLANLSSVKPSVSNTISMLNGMKAE